MKHWISWLPGLETLRRYEAAWLPHDIFAGLVLATMLVPVGIAYATASGLPGIYGLYATIVPLLAYAVFGPSRILVLGPDSALAAVILGVVLPLSGGDPASRRYSGRHDGNRLGDGLHPGGRRAAGLCDRASLQAHTLRLHERNCVDGTDQPTAEALRLLHRERRTLAEPVGDRRRDPWTARQTGRRLRSALGTLVMILLLKNNKRVPGILIAVVGATRSSVLLILGPVTAWRSWAPSPGPAGFHHSLDRL